MQNFQALGASPPDPKHSPPLQISGYAPGNFVLFIIICVFCSFCFEQFFLDRSVLNLTVLIVDVSLMLNCFLFDKFYLHYALCDLGSIYWHCTKLFICQSIDRKQIMDVIFDPPPPIEKSCIRHCSIVKSTLQSLKQHSEKYSTNYHSLIKSMLQSLAHHSKKYLN